VKEIARFAEGTDLELEVFALGALCVSWSGQCLSSEAWGGRSANRGQCAQACRLPYDLIVDGEQRPLGDVAYLLSPKDLAGFRAVKDLMRIGVHGLKIEGRQKGPTYVHAAVKGMRHWVDALERGAPDERGLREDMRDLTLAYSRGFSDGWLAGSDHQTLVEGRFPRHRGAYLGRVTRVDGNDVRVSPLPEPPRAARGEVSAPLPALGGAADAASGPAVAAVIPVNGMGIVFDEGHPDQPEQGGPIFSVRRQGNDWILTFGQPGPDLRKVNCGARTWITSDPKVQAQAQQALRQAEPDGRNPLHLVVRGSAHQPMRVLATCGPFSAEASSANNLQPARDRGLDADTLREKLCAFGGTPFRLESLRTDLEEKLFLPVSELKHLRRQIVEALTPLIEAGPPREIAETPPLPRLLEATPAPPSKVPPRLVPLCRSDVQLEAVIKAGCDEVVLDWMEMVGLGKAVQRARQAGLKVGIATVRVAKPGEEAYDRRIDQLKPDSVLVRHWAGVMHFADWREDRPLVHGDFSLNVTNSITARHVLSLGLETVTASHDLDQNQLEALLEHAPAHRIAVTVHHHIPTFHTEHCVYSNLLSNGRDYRTCGRPCEERAVSLRDRVGLEHPVIVDVGCRNTVFNAAAQSAASLVPLLVRRDVKLLRLEFVRESERETRTVLDAYRDLLEGKITPQETLRRVGTHEQFGVSAGTMQVMR